MKREQLNYEGLTIAIVKMNVDPASLIFTKLKKMLAGSLIEVGASALGGNPSDDEVSAETEVERQKIQLKAIGDAITSICDRNDAKVVHELWKEILCTGSVYINDKPVTHLNDFPELEYMYDALLKALVLNYGDFLKKFITGIMSKLPKKMQ